MQKKTPHVHKGHAITQVMRPEGLLWQIEHDDFYYDSLNEAKNAIDEFGANPMNPWIVQPPEETTDISVQLRQRNIILGEAKQLTNGLWLALLPYDDELGEEPEIKADFNQLIEQLVKANAEAKEVK